MSDNAQPTVITAAEFVAIDKKDRQALRERIGAPYFVGVAPDVLAYIIRLENDVIDLTYIRNQFIDCLNDNQCTTRAALAETEKSQ